MHLDEYLPYVLLDNQNSDVPDNDIASLNPKKVTRDEREDVINLLLKRLEASKEFSEPRPKNKVRTELTQNEIDMQNFLLN